LISELHIIVDVVFHELLLFLTGIREIYVSAGMYGVHKFGQLAGHRG
jgi:hypothetical protein